MPITRRTALAAFGSVPLALQPFLQSRAAEQQGQTPRRFVFVIKSSGVDKENLVPVGLEDQWKEQRTEHFEASWSDHALPENLQPFDEMKDQLTVIQGLSGRNFQGNHTSGYGALACHHSEHVAVAPTVDCLLGQHLSTGPYPMYGMAMNGPLLEQYTRGPQDTYCYPNISAMAKGRPVAYQASPKKAFVELFGAAVASPEQLKQKLSLNSNLMDFMKDDARRVERQLSAEEKERFARYTDAFEALRIREQKKVSLEERIRKFAPEMTNKYESMVPSVRMQLHFELATSALITGLTHVVTLRTDTLGIIYNGLGINQHVHALGHLGDGELPNGWNGPQARKQIDKLQLGYVAAMAKQLRSIPEGDGTMLDNTTIVFMSCAGGLHHGGQRDWPFVLVGGTGGGLKGGRYIQYPSYQNTGHRTIANLYLSLMQSAGMQAPETFGQLDASLKDIDVAGPLTELMA